MRRAEVAYGLRMARSISWLVASVVVTGCSHSYRTFYRDLRPVGSDVTAEYESVSAALPSCLDAPRTAALRRYDVLFVPGFMSDPATALGIYFEDHSAWLREIEVEQQVVAIESEAAPGQNAARIRSAIDGVDKPVLVVSHSKGGIDTLTALLGHAGLRARVAGWITIQTPFRGSPVADRYLTYSAYHGFYRGLLQLLGGSLASLESLGFKRRAAEYDAHAQQIDALLADLPTLAFASWQDDTWPWQGDTLFEPERDLMLKEMGVKNDGLVPVVSGALPGMELVAISGVDHLSSVVRNPLMEFDRRRSFQTLLLMLLGRLQPELACLPRHADAQ